MKKLLVIVLILLSACAAPWIESGGTYRALSHNFYVDIPQGWMRLNTERYLLISREGPFLQYVLIQDRPVDRPFRHTKKKLLKDMLPEEAAQVVIDEIVSDQTVVNLEVTENVPTEINGHDGFRLAFTYRNKDGLTFKTIYYGFIKGEKLYSIRYTAAKRYYFEKDIQAFETLLSSFRLIKAGAERTCAHHKDPFKLTHQYPYSYTDLY